MKIALSVTKLAVGGIATTVLNLCPVFKAAGHEVTVIAQQPGARWPHLAAAGIQGYCLPQRSWESRVMRAKRLRAYLIEQQFDLLLVFIDFENRIPMLCLHELPDSLPVVLSLRSDFAAIYNLAAVNVEAWNCVVGVSPKVQQTAAQHFRHKTVHYIPNGIDFTALSSLPTRQPWATPMRLLYAGRLDANSKGILRLPAILAYCRQQHLPVRLTIIGDGPDRAQLQQQIVDLDLLDLVEFWGTQDAPPFCKPCAAIISSSFSQILRGFQMRCSKRKRMAVCLSPPIYPALPMLLYNMSVMVFLSSLVTLPPMSMELSPCWTRNAGAPIRRLGSNMRFSIFHSNRLVNNISLC